MLRNEGSFQYGTSSFEIRVRVGGAMQVVRMSRGGPVVSQESEELEPNE